MRRALSMCLLATVLAYLSGCGEAPSRPSVVTDRPVNPPKTSARYIQVPWDISLFFNIPGGAIVAGATTAATPGANAEGDNLTGTYVNSTGFAGTLTGVLTGTLENGTFNGSLRTITPSGCPAERQFSGPLNTQTLDWTPGNQINDCGGTSPLTAAIQVTAAPPSAPPPCTYSSSASQTTFPAAGGSGTVTVTAGTGCNWFATSSAGFVTLSAAQGTGNGSVQYSVEANTSTSERTATVVVAGQSFTITQAGVPAPACSYVLNGTGQTFDAAGGLGGVDMRAPAGCAWQAQSDAPWLTITGGRTGTGNGTISFAVAANPGPSQRVGTIATSGQNFTVTQTGPGCVYTVTPSQTAFPESSADATLAIATTASCSWTAVSNVPWMTLPGSESGTGIMRGTGPATISFSVGRNPGAARTGTITAAGQTITITQAAASCVFTLTPSTTAAPAAGGTATIGVATRSDCAWTATATATPAWITVTGTASGQGNGTVTVSFAANSTGQQRTGVVTVGNASGNASATFTQAGTTVGSLSGTVTNSLNNQPVAEAAVVIALSSGQGSPLATPTNSSGMYSFTNIPPGTYNVLVQKPGFSPATGTATITAGQTTTFNAALTPTPVNLVISWSPNPSSVDPNDPGCGVGDRYCWNSTVTIRETGGTAAQVNTWVVRFYNSDGTLDTESTQTRTGTEFAEQFRANPIPGFGSVSSFRQVTRSDSRGGAIDYVLSGVDPYGRSFSSTSPQLVLNPFGGTAPIAPRAPAGARTSDERPANPASKTIRRR